MINPLWTDRRPGLKRKRCGSIVDDSMAAKLEKISSIRTAVPTPPTTFFPRLPSIYSHPNRSEPTKQPAKRNKAAVSPPTIDEATYLQSIMDPTATGWESLRWFTGNSKRNLKTARCPAPLQLKPVSWQHKPPLVLRPRSTSSIANIASRTL